MTDVLTFVLARYNYWIVIVLMMTGLYIVFSRGNLVKTIVGLNIFQTSVFIFYITLGKVAGGTAPILIGGHGEKDDHGDGHGDEHGAGHEGGHDAPHGVDHGALSGDEAVAYATGERANEVGTLAHADLPTAGGAPGLHDAPLPANALTTGAIEANATASHGSVAEPVITKIGPFEEVDDLSSVLPEVEDYLGSGGDAAHAAAEVLYSNPLPHVLILTAIVVGVATTAVGLAIAVRIREAYGTVEEDALEEMDNQAAGYPEGAGTA